MKTLGLIRHLSFVALPSLLIVLGISHSILLYNEVRSVDFHIADYTTKVLSQLNQAMTDVNYVRVREILDLIRDDRAENLVFTSPIFTQKGIAPIEIGQLKSHSVFTRTKSLPISYQGADLGALTYQVNLLQLSGRLLYSSVYLYLFLVLVFSLLILLTNLSILRILYLLERVISQTASRNFTIDSPLLKALPKFLAAPMFSLVKTLESLIAAEQKFAAESAKNQLALQVAHDIRSPVSVINLVIKKMTMVPDEMRSLLVQATDRMSQIATNLIEYERQSALQMAAPVAEAFSLRPIVEEILREKRLLIADRRKIRLELSAGPDHSALIQPIELKRILSNLLNNSIEAIAADGEIRVEIAPRENKLFLSIRDNGRGIPQDVLAKLGTRGFSFGKNPEGSNLGIGLFHAKTTLQRWGGDLQFESQLGVGTTVHVILVHS